MTFQLKHRTIASSKVNGRFALILVGYEPPCRITVSYVLKLESSNFLYHFKPRVNPLIEISNSRPPVNDEDALNIFLLCKTQWKNSHSKVDYLI